MTMIPSKRPDPRLIPLPGELELGRTYIDAAKVKDNIASWSEFDLLRAYTDIKECIALIEDEQSNDMSFDVLQRIKLNVEKVFGSKKA